MSAGKPRPRPSLGDESPEEYETDTTSGVPPFVLWLRQTRWAAFLVTILLHALAFPPLALIYQSKGPQILVALGAGLVGFLFGSLLLSLTDTPLRRSSLYAAVLGLILAELAWAISYWSALGLVGGALLWLAFYVLAGASQAHLEGALDRRVATEYSVVAALGLTIILSSTPWNA